MINTSTAGLRPQSFVSLYSAFRAGANALVRCAGLTAGQYGVTVNATGTYAMNYPSFLHDVGADTDPQKLKEVEAGVPMKRLGEPDECAYFVSSLIDGVGTFQTGQFFALDGGWSFM